MKIMIAFKKLMNYIKNYLAVLLFSVVYVSTSIPVNSISLGFWCSMTRPRENDD